MHDQLFFNFTGQLGIIPLFLLVFPIFVTYMIYCWCTQMFVENSLLICVHPDVRIHVFTILFDRDEF